LMIVQPDKFVSEVRDLGTYMMNVHFEACTHLHRTIQQIKQAGMKAAVTLNPATPVCMLEDILPELDMVLLMSVNPGFGGQKFIQNTLKKVEQLKEMRNRMGLNTIIEIDGGVNLETGKLLSDAGADALVAGSAVFKAEDPIKMIKDLKVL
ncbi:MAG: ribulose-phosphate 3-epimerase, partial [Bacteroidaceae bacterium]|nr:ribulose-phosphate 3-epimerase [Bacteroidaceae bacterium]